MITKQSKEITHHSLLSLSVMLVCKNKQTLLLYILLDVISDY